MYTTMSPHVPEGLSTGGYWLSVATKHLMITVKPGASRRSYYCLETMAKLFIKKIKNNKIILDFTPSSAYNTYIGN